MARKSQRAKKAARSSKRTKKTEPTPTSDKTPARFTAESLKALGFKVPKPRGDGFVIGSGGPSSRADVNALVGVVKTTKGPT
jgi:hypothetical protein